MIGVKNIGKEFWLKKRDRRVDIRFHLRRSGKGVWGCGEGGGVNGIFFWTRTYIPLLEA
jgi:hypothetical protein